MARTARAHTLAQGTRNLLVDLKRLEDGEELDLKKLRVRSSILHAGARVAIADMRATVLDARGLVTPDYLR